MRALLVLPVAEQGRRIRGVAERARLQVFEVLLPHFLALLLGSPREIHREEIPVVVGVGTRRGVKLEEVIAVEGRRVPYPETVGIGDAPRLVRVGEVVRRLDSSRPAACRMRIWRE